uniref:hypothetical protein n=1 Tax=Enterocloster aldenensis TaxID=358742 RepID=UPI0022E370C1
TRKLSSAFIKSLNFDIETSLNENGILFFPFYHNSESVEIESFPGVFPTFRIYGTGGHLGVDLG